MNNKLQSVAWIILVTEHFEQSRTFYKEKLEFDLIRELPEEEFAQFKLANCFLAIYGKTYVEKLVGKQYIKSAGGAIYTFPDAEDIDKTYQKLQAKGVKFIMPPTTQPWNQRTAYFTDPDGHIWEIQNWIK